jgi:hypothetical protein
MGKSGGTAVLNISVGLGIAAAILWVSDAASAEVKPPIDGSYKLPLEGNYGNDSGCNALADDGEWGDDMLYITSKTYRGWESRCHFVQAFGDFEPSHGTRAWTVVASCDVEGIPYSRLFTIWEQPNEMKVTIVDESAPSDEEAVMLKRCK